MEKEAHLTAALPVARDHSSAKTNLGWFYVPASGQSEDGMVSPPWVNQGIVFFFKYKSPSLDARRT